MSAGAFSVLLAFIAVVVLLLPGGVTWLAIAPGVGGAVTGIRSISRDGLGWQAVTGTVVGAGVAVLLLAILIRVAVLAL